MGSPEHSLLAGTTLRFKVIAYNYNGAGSPSEIAALRVCGVPSGLGKPTKLASSTSTPSITARWEEPASTGGCPITGYAVFVDDGAGGAFVEANSDQDALVRDLPGLR